MLIKMKRTQTTTIGKLLAGHAYDLDEKDGAHAEVIASLKKSGFGDPTTQKALDKAQAQAEKVAASQPKTDADVIAALKSEIAALKAAADK